MNLIHQVSAISHLTAFPPNLIRACGEGELVEGMPKLPRGLMLMFDEITSISRSGGVHGHGFVKARFEVKPDLWFFEHHFKGDPVMPGCLELDALWQMLGFYLGYMGARGKGRARGCGEIKLSSEILPSAKVVEYSVDVKNTRPLGKETALLGLGDGTVTCDGKVVCAVKDMRVFVG